MLGVIISFAHMRAYAIRPYTCSIEILAMLVCVSVSFSPTSGRMRYVPTPVRLNSCRFVCDDCAYIRQVVFAIHMVNFLSL